MRNLPMSVSDPPPSAPAVLKCLLRRLRQGLRKPIGTWLKTLTTPGTSPNSNFSLRPPSKGGFGEQCESRKNPGPPIILLLPTPVGRPPVSRAPRSKGPFTPSLGNPGVPSGAPLIGSANTPSL